MFLGPEAGSQNQSAFIAQILVVQADDQDFDVNLVARDPNALVDMEMVKVRPGLNDMYKSLQSEYRARED